MEKYEQILLVEGNDDFHVLSAICLKYNIPQTFDIKEFGGIDKQLSALKELYLTGVAKSKSSAGPMKTIGVIIDADNTANCRWETLKDILSPYISTPLDNMPSGGLIVILENGMRFGLWIMPDNITTGMLENFIEFLIPQDDKLFELSNQFLDTIEQNSLNQYKLIHKQKAKIHSWLSLQEDPGTPMGLAITKKYLDNNVNNQVKNDFIDWIKTLFI